MKLTPKHINHLILIIITGALFSCSSDDVSDSEASMPESTAVYLPLTLTNDWTYDVTTDDNTNPTTSTTDVITVDESTIINTREYYGMSSSTGSSGTMTQLFDQNYFRSEAGVFYTDGNFTLPLSNFGGTDIVISLNEAKLIDDNEANGTVLEQQSGITTQNIGGYDLDVEYTFKTVQRETLTNHTVETEVYNDIVKSDIILSIKVSTTINIGVPIDITLLDTQDVLTITNFYANGIGLIDSTALFTYQLEDLSALPVTLPIPDTATITTIQKINNYTLN
ncbi:MAG: hypothetical protein ACPG45_09810 [Flavobacteriaceae bacterium]